MFFFFPYEVPGPIQREGKPLMEGSWKRRLVEYVPLMDAVPSEHVRGKALF